MNPFQQVEIQTGSRMHFGLICGTQQTGWMFGGVGLMVQQPGWHIRISSITGNADAAQNATKPHQNHPQQTATIVRPEAGQILQPMWPAVACRVQQAWQVVIDKLPTAQLPELAAGAVQLQVLQAPPLHSGFGAGTQLTLALASAAQVLWGNGRSDSVSHISRQLGRAGRSAIGTEGFERGGFIVDAGQQTALDVDRSDSKSDAENGNANSKQEDTHPAADGQNQRSLQRIAIPKDWRFIIVRPATQTGISGDTERAFFAQRQTMTADDVRQLSGLIVNDMLPAVRESNFAKFAVSVDTYGRIAGKFYASTQGDVFAHPQMNALAAWLKHQHIYGAAQSSWGPGICIPAESPDHAQHIAACVQSMTADTQTDITITQGLNRGATIRSVAPETDSKYCSDSARGTLA